MSKVIKIENDFVVVANLDQSVEKIAKQFVQNLALNVGDEVEVYKINDEYIVNKASKDNTPQQIIINNTQPQVISSNKRVNKVNYALIAFFFGGFGIHKFYAGKTGLGILYLLFFWTGIPALVALIEFIVALCKTADADGNIDV